MSASVSPSASLSPSSSASPSPVLEEITEQVAANGDDGYVYEGSAAVTTGGSTYFGKFGSEYYHSWYRFADVSIPAGATIISAELQFKAASSLSGTTCSVNIYFEAADDPSNPTTRTDYLGRTLTDAVAWNSIGSWTADTWYSSPDLTSILQAVIDRGGWAENNAIIAYVKDNSSSTNAYRSPKSRDAGASEGVKLVVEYST